MRTILAVVGLTLMLTACGEKKEVKDTVFAPMVGAKEKARAVEDKLQQGAEKNREALKASEDQDAATEQRPQGY
jgi:hypothetical protein